METETTVLYRILKKYRILKHQKYTNITLLGFIFLLPRKVLQLIIYQYAYNSILLEPINFKWLRAKCWKWIGCNIGKNVMIGRHIELDYGNASLIVIEDNVLIANGCTFLCHKRDNSFNHPGEIPQKLPYTYGGIHLKKNCQIGTNVTIMPGVTIGEGAVIGALSLVLKDIPDWSVAVGHPARVVKQIRPLYDMSVTNE